MRTTVRLDEDIVRRAKALAARTGRSLTKLIEDALRQVLERAEGPARESRFEMVTFRGEGAIAGVDLDDSAGLWDAVEDRATH
jgi:hypothetical protein